MKVIEAKIVVLGSQGVGKTSLVVRYIGKMFSKHISPTIGASFFTCNINLDNARVKLQVWDTAGQERFRSMAPMYYRNANAALLVFDITNFNSFVAIKGWVKELQSNVPEAMVLSVVGNKSDLEELRAVQASEAAQFAESIGAHYCETSALHDQQGIDEVFLNTAAALLKLSSSNLVSSLRSYDSADVDNDKIPTEEDATHTGKVELPAWSIDSIAHGDVQKNMCC
ncbi:ras-related protein Rab-31 isoform X2 [Helicoverpa armigera]|uniref:ras-related protein Rab-31 isoform X2 n=1 Tax=Helicoverpa zea TaxID=7113 RepID=UPI001F59D9F4|nr:ras-related protein Rab-31 isoform X2 [Helicoverpa zea]XP_049701451.1 ras-related protein Rab-31 isoform X2 [Helicoverpa armigera]